MLPPREKPIKIPCVGCRDMFYPSIYPLPGAVRCGECEFLHRLLKPMLLKFAPDAQIEKSVNGVVAKLKRDGIIRCVPFDTTHFRLTPDMIDGSIAATYERVRRLADPSYRFAWTESSI